MRKLSFVLCLTALLSSCASQRFYKKVDGRGEILGTPSVQWTEPNKFILHQQKGNNFAFKRSNGEIIRPESIETDGGSIPSALWWHQGYSPWTYAPAYLIHDWLYEAHRQRKAAGFSADGKPLYYNKEQADWIMAEVIKAQMERPEKYNTPKSPTRLLRIYWAVNRFGATAWNQDPTPVKRHILPSAISRTLENLPLLPTLDSLGQEIGSSPKRPNLKGTKAPSR